MNELTTTRTATILGAYPGPDASLPSTFVPFERWLGRPHAVITLYYDAQELTAGTAVETRNELDRVWASGHVPMVTWQPYIDSRTETPRTLDRVIANGGYDAVIARWRDLLGSWLDADGNRRLYFRPMPEMNGNWHPWDASDPGSTPDDFVDAWVRLYEQFAAAELTGDRVQWLWNPNADDVGGIPAESYYPGGDFVDWVGIDGYNFGDSAPSSSWQSPDEVFGSMVERMRSLTNRPISLPEFGSSSLRNGSHSVSAKSRWISDAFAFIKRHDVRMACWFNIDKETDWAVFGGGRGTTTYGTGSKQYHAYEAYREAVTRDWLIGGDAADGPRESMARFRGRL